MLPTTVIAYSHSVSRSGSCMVGTGALCTGIVRLLLLASHPCLHFPTSSRTRVHAGASPCALECLEILWRAEEKRIRGQDKRTRREVAVAHCTRSCASSASKMPSKERTAGDTSKAGGMLMQDGGDRPGLYKAEFRSGIPRGRMRHVCTQHGGRGGGGQARPGKERLFQPCLPRQAGVVPGLAVTRSSSRRGKAISSDGNWNAVGRAVQHTCPKKPRRPGSDCSVPCLAYGVRRMELRGSPLLASWPAWPGGP